MKSAAHVMAVFFAVVAMAAPTLGEPLRQSRTPERQHAGYDKAGGVDTSFVERQDRLWRKLSSSICTGCITSANRVAPVSYEKPKVVDLSKAQPANVQVAVRKLRSKVRIAHLRKRYAHLHRRNRIRIAARHRRMQIATAARIGKYALHNSASPILSIGWSGFDDRTRVLPIEKPEAPRDDDRRHETILPASEVRPRRS